MYIKNNNKIQKSKFFSFPYIIDNIVMSHIWVEIIINKLIKFFHDSFRRSTDDGNAYI